MAGRWTAVLGGLLAVVGIAALVVPDLTTALPTDDTVVLALGAVLLLGAAREIQRRRHATFEYAETDDTELALELPTPGDEFDRRIGGMRLVRFDAVERQRVRDDVWEVALATIRRRERCSEAEAEEMLREGTWTDDPFAAAFFTRRPPQASRRRRVRELLSSTSPFERRAVRAVDAVYRLAEGEDE